MAKSVDATDLKSVGKSHAGSSPAERTNVLINGPVFTKTEYTFIEKPPRIWCSFCRKFIRNLAKHVEMHK